MILVGVSFNDTLRGGTALVVDQRFRWARKFYRIVSRTDLLPSSPVSQSVATIARIWADPQLAESKRLFSQDRRPAKTVRMRPRIVTSGSVLGGLLREQNVPVERIEPATTAGWKKRSMAGGLGNDYTVGTDMLKAVLEAVAAQQRIDRNSGALGFERLLHSAGSIIDERTHPNDSLVMALALAVWFRETVPYARPYRSV